MERLEITQKLKLGKENRAFLRKAMEQRGITQTAAAEKIGMAHPNLNAALQGHRGFGEQELRELCALVGLRVMARLEVDIYR